MMDSEKWLVDSSHAVLAAIAGVIGAAMRKEDTTLSGYLLRAAGAGLSGLIVAKICRATGVGEDMTYVMTSLAGWCGAVTVMDGIRAKFGPKLGIYGEAPAAAAPPVLPPATGVPPNEEAKK